MLRTNVQEVIVDLIMAERQRQDQKFGRQDNDDFKWCTILGEEYGEVCQAALKGDRNELMTELIQVAAVAVAHLEALSLRL